MTDEANIQDQQAQQPPSYVDKVYSALHDNLNGFSKTPEQFKSAMQDPAYAAKAYSALRDNLTGFNKSQDDFYQEVGLRPKGGAAGSALTSQPLGNGLAPFQSSPANTNPYSYITTTPQAAQQLQQENQPVAAPASLTNYWKSLNPQEQQALLKVNQQSNAAHANDAITATPLQQQGDYNYSQTVPGKIQNGLTYLAQKATKGGLQVVKGAAYLANLGANPLSAVTGQTNPDVDNALNKADQATNFLPKTSEAQVENSKTMANLGGLAEFLPSAAAAEGTGGATLYLQGLGQGKEIIDNAEANGAKINPVVKNAFILGTGAVNGFLMGDLGHGIFNSLGSSLKDDVVKNITMDAIKESAGKDFTAQQFTDLLKQGASDWGDKALQGGVNFLKSTKRAVTDLSALNVGNFALKQGVDATSDQPVFNENLGDLAQQEGETLKSAPLFGAVGSVSDVSKLTPFSEYKNAVVDNLIHDPSNDNIAKTKDFIAQHGAQEGWSPDEIQATQAHIDQIGNVVQSIPKSIPDAKKQQAIDLIINRNELQKQLADVQQQNGQLDPAFQGVANDGQILIDKIDQANDKLKTLVTGNRTTYSKGIEEDDGKFFKTTNGEKEEITKNRYDLENFEREAKATQNSAPDAQPLPDKPQDDAPGEQAVATDVANEETTNNQINTNQQENATTTGVGTENDQQQHQGTPQGEGVQQNGSEVRQAESGQAGNSDSVTGSGNAQQEIKVNEILDKPVMYKGEPAIVTQDGQSLVAKIKGTNREYELGNVDEVGNQSIKDYGIEHTNGVVDTHENGNILVRGKEYVNNYSDPKAAINTDDNGNVVSVNLETPDGEKRAFRGDIAEDIAYQIHLKELNKDNETKQQFEQFVEQHEPSKSAVVAAEDANTAKAGAVKDNAKVSREPGTKVQRVKIEANKTVEANNIEKIPTEADRPAVEEKQIVKEALPIPEPKKVEEKPIAKVEPPKKVEKPIKQESGTGTIFAKTSDIKSDPKQFQPRGTDFSEASTDKIVNNFDDNKLDPIVIYKDGKRDVVLSGHSRLEAHKRLDALPDDSPIKQKAIENGYQDGKVKARYFKGTLDEAKEFADRSNDLGNKNKDYESASSIRKMREAGKSQKEINERASQDFGKDAEYIKSLSYLNPNGDVINALKQLGDSGDKATRTALERIASWIGTARQRLPELTDSHEREMFKFLNDKKNEGISTKADFVSKIASLVNNLHFDPKEPLNINRIKETNSGREAYDRDYADLSQKVKDKEAEIDAIKDRLNNPKNTDYIKPTSPDYDATVKYAEKIKDKKGEELKILRRNLLDLAQKKSWYNSEGMSQRGIFDLEDNTPVKPIEDVKNETEINKALEKHEITVNQIKDYEQSRSTGAPESDTEQPTSTTEGIQQPENDNAASTGESTESTGTQQQQKESALTPEEEKERLELRKKFSGVFRTGIPGKELFDKDFYRYAGLIFKEAKGEFTQFAKTLIDEVGDKIKDSLAHLWEKSGGDIKDVPDEYKEQPKEGGVKKTILTKRAYEGEIQPEVKKYLEDKGLTRQSFSQEERSKQATDFINKFGEDAAFQAVKEGDVEGGMAASILAQLQIRNSRAMSELPEKSDERDELAKKQADNIALMEKKGYLGGEFNGQLAHEYENSELNYAGVKQQVEKLTGKPLTPSQDIKVKQITDENEQLKTKLQEAESKLIEATDKALNEPNKPEQKVKPKTDYAKKALDAVVKVRAKIKENSYSDATGMVALVDSGLATIEAAIRTGMTVTKAIEKGIDYIKSELGKKGIDTWEKEDDFRKDVTDAFAENGVSDSKKERDENDLQRSNIKRLEKELDDLKQDRLKKTPEKREFSDEENDLKKQIKDEKLRISLENMQAEFLDKKDNKFTMQQAKDIWGYMKGQYIDNGVSFKDALSKASRDLGLNWRQINEAVTTPKLKRITDDMWNRNADLARNKAAIKNWIDDQNKNAVWKAWKKISGTVRAEKVFGHSGIFVGTHAALTIFDPRTANLTGRAFINGWKFAYKGIISGNHADYERAMEELKNRPTYLIAQRAGLKNNPDHVNAEEFQRDQGFLGKAGLSGIRGFNAIKVLRQDLFDYEYNKLSPAERDDPDVAKSIAHLMNLGTGATNVNIHPAINEVTFAAGMEMARWEKLFASPAKALSTATKAIFTPDKATPAEKVFAKVWVKRAGIEVATLTTALLASAALQNSLYPKNKVNLTDPDKPDWMKAKFGNMTIDATSGMRSTIQFLYKLGEIPFENEKKLKGENPISASGEKIANYARGKLAPVYSTLADQYAGSDFEGNVLPYRDKKPAKYAHKLTWGEYAWKQAPLPVAEAAATFYQSAVEHGAHKKTLENVLKAIRAGVISGTTGVRVGEYDANAPENKKK